MNGEKNSNITVFATEDNIIHVSGVTTSRTKCNLYFIKGAYILGQGVPIVENGEGLYEINHEDVNETRNDIGFRQTEYRYAGKNPNNYVSINGEKNEWRIIGLVNVETTNGNIEQRVKVIRNSIGKYSWDSSSVEINSGYGINDWNNSKLKNILNDFYYNSKENETCYVGIESQTQNCSFQINGLKESKNFISKDIVWNLGSNGNDNLYVVTSKYYEYERSNRPTKICDSSYSGCTESVSRDTTWSNTNDVNFQSIGLMYPSDYGYATSGGSIDNRNKCLSTALNRWGNYLNSEALVSTDCITNDWLYQENTWTMFSSAKVDQSYDILMIYDTGFLGSRYAADSNNVQPVFYFNPNVKIENGEGTLENPYVLNQTYHIE